MACHFSPYGEGITNIPETLPEKAILILNDRMPCHGHSPSLIVQQLSDAVSRLGCESILLDFIQPPDSESEAMVHAIVEANACPVAVSAQYADGLRCPVFLPPCPLHIPLEEYVYPWKGREIWLEVAPECRCIRITREGSRESEDLRPDFPCPHIDPKLHCRYGMDIQKDYVDFHLRRDAEQLHALLKTSESFGVHRFVGLYQESESVFDQWDAADTARFQP